MSINLCLYLFLPCSHLSITICPWLFIPQVGTQLPTSSNSPLFQWNEAAAAVKSCCQATHFNFPMDLGYHSDSWECRCTRLSCIKAAAPWKAGQLCPERETPKWAKTHGIMSTGLCWQPVLAIYIVPWEKMRQGPCPEKLTHLYRWHSK